MATEKKQTEDAKRLQTALDILRISGNKLATILEKSPSSVYHVLEGRNKMSSNLIEDIVTKFPEISYVYLKTGKGEPHVKREADRQVQKNLFSGNTQDNDDADDEARKYAKLRDLENQTEGGHQRDPLSYNVATQLQQLINAQNKTNELLERLLEKEN